LAKWKKFHNHFSCVTGTIRNTQELMCLVIVNVNVTTVNMCCKKLSKLLQIRDLTLDKAIDVCKASEAAVKQLRVMTDANAEMIQPL